MGKVSNWKHFKAGTPQKTKVEDQELVNAVITRPVTKASWATAAAGDHEPEDVCVPNARKVNGQPKKPAWIDKNEEIIRGILKHHCWVCGRPTSSKLFICLRKGHYKQCAVHPTSFNKPSAECVRCKDAEARQMRDERAVRLKEREARELKLAEDKEAGEVTKKVRGVGRD